MSGHRTEILRFIHEHPSQSNSLYEIADELTYHVSTVRESVEALKAHGLITTTRGKRNKVKSRCSALGEEVLKVADDADGNYYNRKDLERRHDAGVITLALECGLLERHERITEFYSPSMFTGSSQRRSSSHLASEASGHTDCEVVSALGLDEE